MECSSTNLLLESDQPYFVLEENMAKNTDTVQSFLEELMVPSLPFARKEVSVLYDYAKSHGFEETASKFGLPADRLMPWDFSFWAEKYKSEKYELDDEQLKPYFRLENCIDAVFGLAGRLYGISFEERTDIPVYHKDVKVFDVKDSDGRHLALFYADFFPRASKRGGAWMTEFRGQSIRNGVEERPLVSIVTNFTKPSAGTPSLITHDELVTLLHEFGHSLHGMFAEGRYPSLCGTNVARDFVELPSQIMENWAFEPEFLNSFARDYRTGEVIPQELVQRITAVKNYLSGYYQVRQLDFGELDMAWHTLRSMPENTVMKYEEMVLEPYRVLPYVNGTSVSTSFNHIFSGGYSAGYYSYKWAEVLEADAFAAFEENGISFEHVPSGIDTFTVIVHQSEFMEKEQNVISGIHRAVQPDTLDLESGLALIAVVGRGMRANRGTAGRIFAALSHARINVKMIDQGSSELNIIIGVREHDFEAAIKAIYDIFVNTQL